MSDPAPDGVLICGAYGTGKSSAAEEIAARLDADLVPYAAIDLDWLWWFHTGTDDPDADERLGLDNVTDVVENYLASGIRRFVFAGWLADQRELDAFRAELGFPITVVELTAPLGTIERRLRSSPTSGRLEDLGRVPDQLRPSPDAPRVDATIDGDRPVGEVAADILRLLRWER